MDRSIDWEKIENEQGSKLFIGKEMARWILLKEATTHASRQVRIVGK